MIPVIRIAGDHEENIDADKAAEHRRRLEMERDHRKHGDGAQPVDVFAIVASHDRYAAQSDTSVKRSGIEEHA